MKRTELGRIVEPLIPAIRTICEKANAPVGGIAFDGGTSMSERAKGIVGRVYIRLADNGPGWRRKDNHAARLRIKRAVRLLDPRLECRLHAAYSCLSQGEDGVIERRDDSGHVIARYAP